MTPEPILKLIQEAKDKQLKELDLSKKELIEIPVEVFELEQLVKSIKFILTNKSDTIQF